MVFTHNRSRLLIVIALLLAITLPFLQLSAKKKRRKGKKPMPKKGYLASILGRPSHNLLSVNSNYGFLRTGPGKGFAKMRRLRLNEKIRYLGDKSKVTSIENVYGVWMLVAYKKKRGYFFSGYVDIPLSKRFLAKQRWLNLDPLGAQIKFTKNGTFSLHRLGQNSDKGRYKVINKRVHLRLKKLQTAGNRKFARMNCAYTLDINNFTYQALLQCRSANGTVQFANKRYRVPRGQIRFFDGMPLVTAGAKKIKLEANTRLYSAPGAENFYMQFKDGFTSEDSLRYSLDLVKVRLLGKSTKTFELKEKDGKWCLVQLPVSNEGVTDFDRSMAFIFLPR